ncbi:hypothetical protein [Yinghuangia soli]|uniref:DUF2207 domain-containing protein n=1 Tax=Yinghuangia soli TaxID=2908204 RepID=A0AA41PZS9_9ACTN|nr:hypothetical protein [Yinghuangia soli]MCF2528350.1 hypothetical protein [Yinghuangia soli]
MSTGFAFLVPAGLVAVYAVLARLSQVAPSAEEYATAQRIADGPVNVYQAAAFARQSVTPQELAVRQLRQAGLVHLSRHGIVRALDKDRQPDDDPVQRAAYALLLADFDDGLTVDEIGAAREFRAALEEHAPPLLRRVPVAPDARYRRLHHWAVACAVLTQVALVGAVCLWLGLTLGAAVGSAVVFSALVWPAPLLAGALGDRFFPSARHSPKPLTPLTARCTEVVGTHAADADAGQS